MEVFICAEFVIYSEVAETAVVAVTRTRGKTVVTADGMNRVCALPVPAVTAVTAQEFAATMKRITATQEAVVAVSAITTATNSKKRSTFIGAPF